MHLKRHVFRLNVFRRLAIMSAVYVAVWGISSNQVAAQTAPPVPAPQSSFWADVATPNPLQPYTAAYAMVPPACTVDCAKWEGTVTFYMGPASNTALGALQGAAAMAVPSTKNYIVRLINEMQAALPFTGPPIGMSTATGSAQPAIELVGASAQCGNEICYRYEEMKYCWQGVPSQSGDGGCNQAYQKVAGVFSYDNNGAYATDGNDFVDCSDHYNYNKDYQLTVNWCSYWRSGPFSDPTNEYMDYGMNLTEDANSQGGTQGVWVRMDDYAGCGSVGNRGGHS